MARCGEKCPFGDQKKKKNKRKKKEKERKKGEKKREKVVGIGVYAILGVVEKIPSLVKDVAKWCPLGQGCGKEGPLRARV